MILQIHDELLFNGQVELPDLSHISPILTPVDIKQVECWKADEDKVLVEA